MAYRSGAPPDPFSANGQIWCLPPPDPVAMRRDGYTAFNELLVANMRHAGALRIDHVMGLRRLFVVPEGAGAIDGAYVSYPMTDLLAQVALESQRARCLVVGEDLGTVPEGMSEAVGRSPTSCPTACCGSSGVTDNPPTGGMAPPGRCLRIHP